MKKKNQNNIIRLTFILVLFSLNANCQNLLEDYFEDHKSDVKYSFYIDIAKDSTTLWIEDLKCDSLVITTPYYNRVEYWQEDSTHNKVGLWIIYIKNKKLTVIEGMNNPYFDPLITEYHYKKVNKVVKITYNNGKKIRTVIKSYKSQYHIPSVIDLME